MYKFVSLSFIALFSFFPGAAQGGTEPTKAEVQEFRLSMEKVNATTRALENVFELVAADPQLVKQWKKADDDDDHDGMGITATVEKLGRTDKRIPAAFAKAGISPKEVDMTMATIAGGMLGLAMADSAGVKDLKLEKGMAKDNIDFIRTHKAEITQAFEKIKALQNKYEAMNPEKGSDE